MANLAEELTAPITIDLGDGKSAVVTHRADNVATKADHGRVDVTVTYGVVETRPNDAGVDEEYYVMTVEGRDVPGAVWTKQIHGDALDDGAGNGLNNKGVQRGRFWKEDAVAAANLTLPTGG